MHLLTYLLTQLALVYEAGNISETVENRAKATINSLYKVVHGLSIVESFPLPLMSPKIIKVLYG